MANYTTYNDTGYTSIPSTIQAHMKGIIEANKGQDYVAFRSGEGVYNLVIGTLKYDSNVISGHGIMYTYNYFYNSYSIQKGGFDGSVYISSEKNYAYSNVSTQTPQFQQVQAVSSIEIFIMFSVVFIYVVFRDLSRRWKKSKRVRC